MNTVIIDAAVEGAKLVCGALTYHTTSKVGTAATKAFLRTAPRIFKSRKQAAFAAELVGMGLGCSASLVSNEAIDEAYNGFKTIAKLKEAFNKSNKQNAKEVNEEKGDDAKDSTEKKD